MHLQGLHALPPQIPEGHVLLSPNVIVPMEALKQGWLLNCAQVPSIQSLRHGVSFSWEASMIEVIVIKCTHERLENK
jgi:hypothetical protein